MFRRSAWAISLFLLAASASAQQAVSVTHVTGVVLDAETMTPIRRAHIDSGAMTAWSSTFTDEQGTFAVDVSSGTTLTISKAGFAPETVNAPSGASLPLQISMHRAAAIIGHLVDGSGTPLFNVNVALRDLSSTQARAPSRLRTTTTNDLGEFRFGALSAGEFALQSPIAAEPVRVRPGDTLDVGDVVYERVTSPPVRSARVADPGRRPAVTGVISDEFGEPIQGVMIHLLQMTRIDDRLAAMPADDVEARMSDDLGHYRIFNVPHGRYLVVADVAGYLTTYYPSVTNVAYALPVAIDRADIDVDFTFHPEASVRVSGTALNSAGQPAIGSVLLGVSQRSGSWMTAPKVRPLASDGTFTFDNIPAGEYVVQVSTPVAGLRPKVEGGTLLVPRMEFGMQRLTITDAEPAAVLLRTSLGATIWGKIVGDGSFAVPRSLSVSALPTDMDQSFRMGQELSGLTRNDDGSFVITGVTGPRRFALISPVDGWYLKEARVRGADALDTPFDFGLVAKDVNDVEVVVSSAAAAVSGTVTGLRGESIADYAVLLFSADESKRYRYSQSMRIGRPAGSPGFHIGSLPPGKYYLVALSRDSDLIASGDWQDEATLEKLRAQATEVALTEGETRILTLRVMHDP